MWPHNMRNSPTSKCIRAPSAGSLWCEFPPAVRMSFSRGTRQTMLVLNQPACFARCATVYTQRQKLAAIPLAYHAPAEHGSVKWKTNYANILIDFCCVRAACSHRRDRRITHIVRPRHVVLCGPFMHARARHATHFPFWPPFSTRAHTYNMRTYYRSFMLLFCI